MNNESKIYKFSGKALQVSLLLLALCAPLSIAGTQIAWSLAILFWLIRAGFVRPTFRTSGIDLAVLAFIGLTLASSVFSYEPQTSLRKMATVSLVTIVYLVSGNIRDAGMLRRLIVILLVSAAFTAAYTIGKTAVGSNLKVVRLTPDSPLRAAGIEENDTILTAKSVRIDSVDDLASVFAEYGGFNEIPITIYRHELINTYKVPLVASGEIRAESFGILEWSRGRDVRAAGFFGHYTTYAEAVQLIASLALGLLILVPGGFFARNRVMLALALAAFCVGLFLTVTRASWAGFLISAAVMILIGTTRKTVLICIACAVPVAIAGIYYLQQKRNVGFVDTGDGSTAWRLMVWREGFNVLVSSPRHLAFGIGMDALKSHWQDWHMFDNGWQPLGHMHSTPLQIAFERGVPTLIAWIIWMAFYLRLLWRGCRRKDLAWFERGVLLGVFGGTVGFLSGGLVHYNWGDSEVVMIFYLLMGLSFAILRRSDTPPLES